MFSRFSADVPSTRCRVVAVFLPSFCRVAIVFENGLPVLRLLRLMTFVIEIKLLMCVTVF